MGNQFENTEKFTKYEDIKVGDRARFEQSISASDIDTFARLTGDTNPLHVNDKFGQRTRFGGRVAHGMLSASFISTMIGKRLPGTGALFISLQIDFKEAVRIDDTIRIEAEVARKFDSVKVIQLQIKIFNQYDQLILQGAAKVMLLTEKETTLDIYNMGGFKMEGFMDFKDKVVLITGGNTGIGETTAKLFGLAGAKVAINYIANEPKAKEVVEEIIQNGSQAMAVKADVTNEKNVHEMVEKVKAEFGSVDILINNASPPLNRKNIMTSTREDFQRDLDVIVMGAYHCCRAVIEDMKAKKSGKIVNIISSAVLITPSPNMVSYITAKSALLGFSKCLANELAPVNVHVNMVSPGMTETSLISHIPEAARKMVSNQLPLRRLANPLDIARVILFLASNSADYMTGVNIPVCGGEVMG